MHCRSLCWIRSMAPCNAEQFCLLWLCFSRSWNQSPRDPHQFTLHFSHEDPANSITDHRWRQDTSLSDTHSDIKECSLPLTDFYFNPRRVIPRIQKMEMVWRYAISVHCLTQTFMIYQVKCGSEAVQNLVQKCCRLERPAIYEFVWPNNAIMFTFWRRKISHRA